MKTLLLALITAATAFAGEVSDHMGLELYSLRVLRKQSGLAAVLQRTHELGFKAIEGGSPHDMTILQYKAQLASLGLTMPSMGFDYGRLEQDITSAVNQASALGVSYVMVAWIPHDDKVGLTAAEADKAARDFNAWGAAFRAAGITFTYHPHGYEFRPLPGGTNLFDSIVAKTNPEYVSFEMDVFWVAHGGQDPVKLLAKYPSRWSLMHVKDIRKGATTGIYTGHAPASDDVAVGSGQIDWPAVLKEAQAVGVKWYFIEDESDSPDTNIPASLAYIRSLGV
ncbi:MAG TPA: sugar phosphate isomerase/epimerase [Opitutaceae bacterium]|jgi:sugar phosphate isomerase/epimerase